MSDDILLKSLIVDHRLAALVKVSDRWRDAEEMLVRVGDSNLATSILQYFLRQRCVPISSAILIYKPGVEVSSRKEHKVCLFASEVEVRALKVIQRLLTQLSVVALSEN